MAKFTVNTHHAYLNNDIVIKSEEKVVITDKSTGIEYMVHGEVVTHLCAGKHILSVEGQEEEIIIEDAIKLGGSIVKNAFIFDNNPWIFVTTKDRLYATNIDTKEEKVEYNITPEEIESFERYYGNPCEYFLFRTSQDYSIYNVLNGKRVFSFTNHIYSDNHLVIYKKDNSIIVYDYRSEIIITTFEGQYSFGNKFYFVKDDKLYGLNLRTNYINSIDCVGSVKEDDMLIDNHLLKLENDFVREKKYIYFNLGNGESNISQTDILLPYYIHSWGGNKTSYSQKCIEEYRQFCDSHKDLWKHKHISHVCFGINVIGTSYSWQKDKRTMSIFGEIISYPALNFKVPFKVDSDSDANINFKDFIIDVSNDEIVKKDSVDEPKEYILNKGELLKGKSKTGNLLVTKENNILFYRNIKEDKRAEILSTYFDSSRFSNAFFTSDGKNVVLQISDTEAKMLGLADSESKQFEVNSFTVARTEGFNGYKPEITVIDGRIPVWRDPITLNRIEKEDMSGYEFKSPDGKYSVKNTQPPKHIYFNTLEKMEISDNELRELVELYDWNNSTTDSQKETKIEKRKLICEKYGKELLFKKIYDEYKNFDQNKRKKLIDNEIENYIKNKQSFTKLFVDYNGYVFYVNNITKKEKKILIGRNVWFLNYVSFSYDSKYLAFGAKMRQDEFRFSEEGVFVLYDIEKEEVILRHDKDMDLWAVWMTMFSKKGDVAFYDSKADAYIANNTNYSGINKVPGKSLLCFSPSGNFIALSDQNYIDYTHHPNENWGHQPSGNIFVYSADDIESCVEHYNDFGEGIIGVASRAGNVASAAFSQDEKRLLAVGSDGVVVVRNLKLGNKKVYPKEVNDKSNRNDYQDDDYGTHYGEFAGSYAQDVMGYSDDVINDAFEGDPDAYWNID